MPRGLPVQVLARVLGVPRSSFYRRSKQPSGPAAGAPVREIADRDIVAAIEDLLERDPSYARYGYRRLRALLARHKGWTINHKRLRRILAEAGLGQARPAGQEERMTRKTGHNGKGQKHAESQGGPDTTRERLLTVAEQLFARKGFAGTSVREIGAVLGLANASILYHFPSKEKLYAAVLSRIAQSVKASIEALLTDSGDASEQVLVMAERFMTWAQAHTDYLQIIMREVMENPVRLANVRSLYLAGVVNTMRLPLEKAKSEGKLGALDPTLFLIHLIGSMMYFTVALPTVGRITGNEDPDELQRRYQATIRQVIAACLKAGAGPQGP